MSAATETMEQMAKRVADEIGPKMGRALIVAYRNGMPWDEITGTLDRTLEQTRANMRQLHRPEFVECVLRMVRQSILAELKRPDVNVVQGPATAQ